MSRRRPVAALAALLAVLPALLLLGGAALPAEAATPAAADRVLVVGVPGLTWADVGPATPALRALAGAGSIGALSVRAARSRTCLLDGMATLGAGNRAAFAGPPNPAPEDPALAHCGWQEEVAARGPADPTAALAATARDPATRSFGAKPGALGRGVGCAGVAGAGAALAVAAPGVRLTGSAAVPTDPAGLARLLSGCPLAVIALDQLVDAGTPGGHATDTGTAPQLRAAALRQVDQAVGRLRAAVAALPGRTLVLLAGSSEVGDARPQLHVGIAAGPGFPAGRWLTSSSTGRTPFVQLIDLAPTALRALGRPVPAAVDGEPVRAAARHPPLADAVSALDRDSTAAAVHYRSTGVFFWALDAVGAVVLLAGLGVLGVRHRRARPRGRMALRALALAAAALPVASYLAGLVPWARAGYPRAALLGAVLAADLVVAVLAAAGPWRRHPLGPAAAVLGVTGATLVVDVVTGSHLELDGLLGYDAVVAGRFTGYGNLTFALLVTCALPLTAALAAAAGRRVGERHGPRRARRTTAAAVLLLGAGVVGLDAAPGLGRDFGGVLAAVPGFLLLAMLLTGVRVTVGRLVGVLAAAVAVVGGVAVLDWLRPADARTHLGRFVQQLLDGQAGTVVGRKAGANLHILLHSPLSLMLVVALGAAVWSVRPGGVLRTGAPGDWSGHRRVLRAGLTATAVSLAIGAAVNDSGVALPATAAAVLVPLLVWLAAGPRPTTTPTGGPVAGPSRVTVGSRGSTVRTA